MKAFLNELFNLLKKVYCVICYRHCLRICNYKISDILYIYNKILISILNYKKVLNFLSFFKKVKFYRETFFNKNMTIIFDFFKNQIILRIIIFFIFSFILLVLYTIIVDIQNFFIYFKIYFSILFLNVFVLKMLILKFEKTQEIQILNLIFLYLNLLMFILFF